ncbi:GntR family transcriptional regulator [Vitreimonas sp.]|uniref:GntR family transcriptional regulator n=1 Tax=Vitreimonas sp. TaxID=3069702 RepID=UPI002ED87586
MAKSGEPTIPERAYQEIKRRLLDGTFKLRQRLDASAISHDLGISVTPVREALVRLAAERFVIGRPAKGFYAMLWTEAQLRELYLWRGLLAQLALEQRGRQAPMPMSQAAYPDLIAALLAALHDASVNPEIVRAADNAEDRLRRARAAETSLWEDVREEAEALAEILADAKVDKAVKAVLAYHSRRAAHARDIRNLAALHDLPANGG